MYIRFTVLTIPYYICCINTNMNIIVYLFHSHVIGWLSTQRVSGRQGITDQFGEYPALFPSPNGDAVDDSVDVDVDVVDGVIVEEKFASSG